jgi:hypothetical protein
MISPWNALFCEVNVESDEGNAVEVSEVTSERIKAIVTS